MRTAAKSAVCAVASENIQPTCWTAAAGQSWTGAARSEDQATPDPTGTSTSGNGSAVVVVVVERLPFPHRRPVPEQSDPPVSSSEPGWAYSIGSGAGWLDSAGGQYPEDCTSRHRPRSAGTDHRSPFRPRWIRVGPRRADESGTSGVGLDQATSPLWPRVLRVGRHSGQHCTTSPTCDSSGWPKVTPTAARRLPRRSRWSRARSTSPWSGEAVLVPTSPSPLEAAAALDATGPPDGRTDWEPEAELATAPRTRADYSVEPVSRSGRHPAPEAGEPNWRTRAAAATTTSDGQSRPACWG